VVALFAIIIIVTAKSATKPGKLPQCQFTTTPAIVAAFLLQ
jgi:hypothetical protein